MKTVLTVTTLGLAAYAGAAWLAQRALDVPFWVAYGVASSLGLLGGNIRRSRQYP